MQLKNKKVIWGIFGNIKIKGQQIKSLVTKGGWLGGGATG